MATMGSRGPKFEGTKRGPGASTKKPSGISGARTKPSSARHDHLRRPRMGKKSRDGFSPGVSGVSPEGREEGPDFTPPEGGYELYRHKNAGSMRTNNWHGFYWARRNEEGDYEIRTLPVSSGEYPASGGVFPREGFEKHYVRVAW